MLATDADSTPDPGTVILARIIISRRRADVDPRIRAIMDIAKSVKPVTVSFVSYLCQRPRSGFDYRIREALVC
jgi:hypothetical protein